MLDQDDDEAEDDYDSYDAEADSNNTDVQIRCAFPFFRCLKKLDVWKIWWTFPKIRCPFPFFRCLKN